MPLMPTKSIVSSPDQAMAPMAGNRTSAPEEGPLRFTFMYNPFVVWIVAPVVIEIF